MVNANVYNLANRLEPARAEVSEYKAKEQALIVTLIQQLQSSLELTEILGLFFDEIRTLIPMDGLCYTHDEEDTHFSTPNQGRHKISYTLKTNHENLGTVIFSSNSRFTGDHLESLENLIPSMLYPLKNGLKYQRALKAATTDPLTGCGNRAALENALHRELDLAARDETPLSLVMFDFDHFKALNDTHGHQAGDFTLQRAVSEIQGIIRKTDLLFRYGGEEFVLLMHKTNVEGAAMVAEKIRKRIETMAMQFQGKTLKASISAGAASLRATDNISSLIERADKLLYAAKDEGRNRVCVELTQQVEAAL